MFIYQHKNWPRFSWDNELLVSSLSQVRQLQGKIIGKMESLGFDLRKEAVLETMTLDIIKSTEIEGEILNPDQVRSSVAKRLGMDIGGLIASDRHVDGMVDLMMDATQHCMQELTQQRLFDWHAALFPTGRNSMYKITVGDWRQDLNGPMQVISGPIGKEKVHFQAPDAKVLQEEMDVFVDWFNTITSVEPVIKAGIGHLWFVTLHPFDDGNGRIARALTDMLLARADGSPQRFYSMSAQIRLERKSYYAILEKTQRGNLNITPWLEWFMNCLVTALQTSDVILARVLKKAAFWQTYGVLVSNPRQQTMLNLLLDGHELAVTSSKWAKVTKCSQDTASRDIQDLLTKNILRKTASGGRSTKYELCD